MRLYPFGILTILILLLAGVETLAQNRPCSVDPLTLQFEGNPVEQAKCLLRPNGYGGILGPALTKLPGPLEKAVGAKVTLSASKLLKYLTSVNISESEIGGPLTDSLATAQLPNGQIVSSMYFVIHDTSTPNLRDELFPVDMDTDIAWRGNKLSVWMNSPVAHVFVARTGVSMTATPFSQTVIKGWGTKFARDRLKADAKGLQIHIELVQPRRRDPRSSNPDNDLIAPDPGFSKAQYDRLAILYMAASIRRGTWLIPAYHSAVDAGIKDAHDDPQNFDLDRFASSLEHLIRSVK